jgi:hypothetical protein
MCHSFAVGLLRTATETCETLQQRLLSKTEALQRSHDEELIKVCCILVWLFTPVRLPTRCVCVLITTGESQLRKRAATNAIHSRHHAAGSGQHVAGCGCGCQESSGCSVSQPCVHRSSPSAVIKSARALSVSKHPSVLCEHDCYSKAGNTQSVLRSTQSRNVCHFDSPVSWFILRVVIDPRGAGGCDPVRPPQRDV